MKRLSPALFIAVLLTSCATSEAPPPPAEPAFLTDEQVTELWNEAYQADSQPESEAAFTRLIARDDITEEQRARLYMGRGIKRGIFVRDDPRAYPQCSVLDFRAFEQLADPDDPRMEQMIKNRAYQFSRFQYFDDAPEDCKSEARIYQEELLSRR